MTKLVRIEKRRHVHLQGHRRNLGQGYPAGRPDTLARTIELNHPTAMTGPDVYLTNTRYIVVKEAP